VWGDGVTDREGSCRKTSRKEAGFHSASEDKATKVLLIAESDLQPRHFCRSLASVIYPPTCGFDVLTTFADSLRSSVDIFLLLFLMDLRAPFPVAARLAV